MVFHASCEAWRPSVVDVEERIPSKVEPVGDGLNTLESTTFPAP
jgi:hypothetical protein